MQGGHINRGQACITATLCLNQAAFDVVGWWGLPLVGADMCTTSRREFGCNALPDRRGLLAADPWSFDIQWSAKTLSHASQGLP